MAFPPSAFHLDYTCPVVCRRRLAELDWMSACWPELLLLAAASRHVLFVRLVAFTE